MNTFLKFWPAGRTTCMGPAPIMEILEKLKNLNLIILKLEYKFEVFEVLARRAGWRIGLALVMKIFEYFKKL